MSDEQEVNVEVKPTRVPLTPEQMEANLAEVEGNLEAVNAVKADFKSRKEPIPEEVEKEAMKLRRQRRFYLKRLGRFIPVSERPKKAKPIKVDTTSPDGQPIKRKAKKAKAEAEAEDIPETAEGTW